jgi:hypothetical protein
VNSAVPHEDKARRLAAIIDTYGLDSFKAQLNAPAEQLQIRIGFVGEFSSGKSTLLNAILGEALLPSRSTPTTANIIEIEADAALQIPEYLSVDETGSPRCISASEFADLACGQNQETLRLRLPPRGMLQPGIQLIDSPGINALVAGHADITLAQLSLLDGLVVCLHCEMGTVPANVLRFLESEAIQRVAHKLLFVLTAADQKAPGSVARVSESMADALKHVVSPSKTRPHVITTRALNVLAGDPEGIALFVHAFDTSFVARASLLRQERRALQLGQLADLIRTSLRAYQQSLAYTDEEFEKQLSDGKTQLGKLRQEKADQKRRLEEWYQTFRQKLQGVGERFASVLARSEADQVDTVFAQLEAALSDVAQQELNRYAPQAHIESRSLPPELKASLASALQAHAKYVEAGVTIATMAAVSVATAGAGAGAVAAAEAGTATAAAQSTSAAAVKAGATHIAKATAKKAGTVAAETVLGQLFKSTVSNLATTVKAINPFEIVGTAIRNVWNGSEAKAALPQLTARLADAYHTDMIRHLDDAVFRPLEDELLAVEAGMIEARKARSESIDAFAHKRDLIARDLSVLNELAASA